jgi:hypothetical protein
MAFGADEKARTVVASIMLTHRAACSSSSTQTTAPAPASVGSAAALMDEARLRGPSLESASRWRSAPVRTIAPPDAAGPAIRSARKAVSASVSAPWLITTPA